MSAVLESFSLSTFADHIGDDFQVELPDVNGAVTLSLARADPLGKESEDPASGRAPFSLVFRGPLTPVYEQATYRFSHPTIGEFDMFIVPIGPGDGGMRYEAIFT